VDNEQTLRARIRADLPAEAFLPQPMRSLLVVPLVGAIAAGSLALAVLPLPWYVALLGSLLLGNLYGSLMFLGHEIGHGATVRSQRLQDLCLYLAGAVFCLSPHLWRVWHNQVHHPHTNVARRDPDTFGTLEEFAHATPRTRFFVKFAPGSGHWLSALYLVSFFTVQAQGVLWRRSRSLPGFGRLRRRRAALDSALMAALWVLVCVLAGPRGALFVVLLPMLAANAVVMAYVSTNHMLRPLTETRDILGTTMSVSTCALLDRMHFAFSHHVEHHLFPGMRSSYYPLVRRSLQRHAPGLFMAPPHWWALLVLFRTPRLYDGPDRLIEPHSGRTVAVADVEALLEAD
jgi:fatty acid desaturase